MRQVPEENADKAEEEENAENGEPKQRRLVSPELTPGVTPQGTLFLVRTQEFACSECGYIFRCRGGHG